MARRFAPKLAPNSDTLNRSSCSTASRRWSPTASFSARPHPNPLGQRPREHECDVGPGTVGRSAAAACRRWWKTSSRSAARCPAPWYRRACRSSSRYRNHPFGAASTSRMPSPTAMARSRCLTCPPSATWRINRSTYPTNAAWWSTKKSPLRPAASARATAWVQHSMAPSRSDGSPVVGGEVPVGEHLHNLDQHRGVVVSAGHRKRCAQQATPGAPVQKTRRSHHPKPLTGPR